MTCLKTFSEVEAAEAAASNSTKAEEEAINNSTSVVEEAVVSNSISVEVEEEIRSEISSVEVASSLLLETTERDSKKKQSRCLREPTFYRFPSAP